MLVGKKFSFTPDEANVDDLVKACEIYNKDILSYTELKTEWETSTL